ncbi:hypothetical protein AgCh_027386 [Apium graveolens]
MLTKTNYTAWAIKMKVFMQAHGVWDAIEPKDPKATVEEKIDKRAMVKKMKVQNLKAEFESLTMKETEQLDNFCMRLIGLVTNIRALGENIKETYVVKKLLRAVPTKFLQIASAIEQFGDLEEMTSRGGIRSNNEARSKEFVRGSHDRGKVRRFNCLAYGHYAPECRKPRRDREQRNEVNLVETNDDEPTLLLAKHHEVKEDIILLNEGGVIPKLNTVTNEKGGQSNVLYLNNGASNHMTDHHLKFKYLDEGVTGRVKFGDGSTVEIQGKGSVQFTTNDGKEYVLKEIYFIPNLCNNIISLGQLSESGSQIVIKVEYLWIHDENNMPILKIKISMNRLYKVILRDKKNACLLAKTEEISRLWHSRQGHINFQSMLLMSRNGMARGLPDFTNPRNVCKGCLVSKQVRRPFPSQTDFTAKKYLELVHGDICGPISPPTLSGNKYFQLFVDGFSRAIWVYMLKRKDVAFTFFKKFKALVEKESRQEIKILRTDRGGEFCSKEFRQFYEDEGIVRHFTVPYTPQQNGVVERHNRTVVAMGRSLLNERNMPSYMWGEAIRHVVYLHNQLPTRAVSGATP